MSNKLTNIIAILLFIWVFLASVFSMKGDSNTMDELAHLPAGYSYLTQQDMRLNPEHPPLIKNLAAFPLLFIKGIHFPSEIKAWQEDINGQWVFGNHFLYKSGNPEEQMVFWGRFPMVLVSILLGFFIFKWARELFGNKAALLSLFFFSFSPTFLAHGRLITTDVGAALGAFISTYYFVKFLENPSKKNIIWAGISFGLAMLLKFSLILLVPFFGIIVLIKACLCSENKSKIKAISKYVVLSLLVGIIGMAFIWPLYQYHVLNYPAEKQVEDTKYILSTFGSRELVSLVVWMADKPILRAYAQYFLGLFMVLQRGVGGNTTYFLGEISRIGWKNYFPIIYAIKVPLAFHILTLISLWYVIRQIRFNRNDSIQKIKNWFKNHFAEFSMLLFIAVYWAASLYSNLNIGIRHLLPAFPFAFLLVGGLIIKFVEKNPFSKIKYFFLGALILWQMFSVASTYPHFLTYFNELTGGPKYGHLYAVDSNLDWGQDLKRLKTWTDENLPKDAKIYLDYFGGSDPRYYLKERFEPWWGERNPQEFPKGNYLAVSATFLQGGKGIPISEFDQSALFYQWLNHYKPIAIIGHSIFIYYID